MRKLTHEEIVKRQGNYSAPGLPLIVVLNNIRSLYNVGSIFRTADGAGVEKIWLCGITGYPPQQQISKTALGAEDRVAWEHSREIIPVLKEVKRRGYEIILLEQTDSSISFEQWTPGGSTCLVLGNEVEGVSHNIVELCDKSIEIEMSGVKNSLNVGVAFGIVAYHYRNAVKSNLLS